VFFSRKKLGIVAAALFFLGSFLLGACGSASSPSGTAPTSTPSSVATTGSTSTMLGGSVHTTSTTLLFPSQKQFMQELSGDGYQTAIVSTDWGGGTVFTIVWIAVDPDKVAPETHDAIFDQAVTLAKRHGAADSTEGRLRVELFDSTQGGSLKDLIVESRDFDLHSPTSFEPTTVTTKLFSAIDTMLAWLRLDVEPRAGVRLAVGGLREIPADGLGPRKRLIEGEIIIENRSATPFAYGPDDFRLYVGPFRTQIEGMTASTDFPVHDAVLAPTPVDGHEFMSDSVVAPGDTLHGYLLTWIANQGTASYGLQYDPSDAEAQKVGGGYMNQIQP
jgi:hypothetical protein